MNLQKKELGEEIKSLLIKEYSSEKISDWADRLLINMEEKSEVYFILNRLSLMEAGPEFEYTEQELWMLAELLFAEVNDPIKQIDDLKFKKND